MRRLLPLLLFCLIVGTGLSLADGFAPGMQQPAPPLRLSKPEQESQPSATTPSSNPPAVFDFDAKPPEVKPPAGTLKIEKVEFFYKADADARFLELKSQWQNRNRGVIGPTTTAELAKQADAASSVEKPIEQWRIQGGANPNVIWVRVHLYNNSPTARLNNRLSTVVRLKTGPLLVNPRTLITDFDHLYKNAAWQTLSSETRTIPVFIPGEDKLEVVYAFSVPAFLRDHPDRWPVQLEVKASLPDFGASKTASLPLIPDQFTLHKMH